MAGDCRNVADDDDDNDEEDLPDFKVSETKLKAVYPGRDVSELIEMSHSELHQVRDLTSIFSTTKIITSQNSGQSSKSIKKYIDSGNKGTIEDPAIWPLIKCVKVYLNSLLLKDGLVLVDLPGLGDENAARRQVTQGYIQNLQQMWIGQYLDCSVNYGLDQY